MSLLFITGSYKRALLVNDDNMFSHKEARVEKKFEEKEENKIMSPQNLPFSIQAHLFPCS